MNFAVRKMHQTWGPCKKAAGLSGMSIVTTFEFATCLTDVDATTLSLHPARYTRFSFLQVED